KFEAFGEQRRQGTLIAHDTESVNIACPEHQSVAILLKAVGERHWLALEAAVTKSRMVRREGGAVNGRLVDEHVTAVDPCPVDSEVANFGSKPQDFLIVGHCLSLEARGRVRQVPANQGPQRLLERP